MPMVTNVSRGLIHAGSSMLVPGQPVDIDDELMENELIKEYLKAGVLKKGEVEVKPEVEQDEAPALRETATTRPATTPGKVGNQR